MKGWFSEVSDEMWPGQALSLKMNEVLFKVGLVQVESN
jgi:spermidine synthase